MREIKFRAWMKDSKLMIEDVVPIKNEVYGHYCKDFEQDTDRYLKLENPEIMQYTGLKDKNGKEIYEGDVLDHPMQGKRIVYYPFNERVASYGLREISTGMSSTLQDSHRVYEIIGNIHENPELLGVHP